MTMTEIFENNYNELTQTERNVITTTDLRTTETLQFDDITDFKEWAKGIISEEE